MYKVNLNLIIMQPKSPSGDNNHFRLHFIKDKTNGALVITTIIFILLGSLIYKRMVAQFEAIAIQRLIEKEQIISQAGAKSLENYLEHVSRSLISLSSSLDISNVEDDMASFLEEWKGTAIESIAFINSDGTSQITVTDGEAPNIIKEDINQGQTYLWAKDAKEKDINIGSLVLPVGVVDNINEQTPIIPVSTPIVRDGNFSGVVVVPVSVSTLAESHIDPFKVSDETRVYLINSKGFIMYSPISSRLLGSNYFEFLEDVQPPGWEQTVEKLRDALDKGQQGSLDVLLPNEKTGELTRFAISYIPVKEIGDENIVLAIATPSMTIIGRHRAILKDNLLAVGAFFVVWISTLTAISIVALRVTKQDAYDEGYEEGKRNGQV